MPERGSTDSCRSFFEQTSVPPPQIDDNSDHSRGDQGDNGIIGLLGKILPPPPELDFYKYNDDFFFLGVKPCTYGD